MLRINVSLFFIGC